MYVSYRQDQSGDRRGVIAITKKILIVEESKIKKECGGLIAIKVKFIRNLSHFHHVTNLLRSPKIKRFPRYRLGQQINQ